MLDRMVGYRISPLLWAKVKRGLSAGRVQSVALRIICDREEEINAFIPEEYWTLDVDLQIPGEKKPLVAKFYGDENGKRTIRSKEEMDGILAELKDADYQVLEVKKGERTKKAPLPFTTSTLQQEASKVLNFSTQKTMRLAQQLYEGVDVKGSGTVGMITYLRTVPREFPKRHRVRQPNISVRPSEKNTKPSVRQKRQTAIRSRMRMRRSVPPISQEHRRRSKIP